MFAPGSILKELKIFIVEDSRIFSNWIKDELLKMEGVQISGSSENANDAILAIRETKPDIIILDIRLNNGSGIDVLKEIRQTNQKAKVVMFTNYPTFKKECMKLGANYFFDKSLDADKIMDTLENLIFEVRADKTN